MRNRPFVGGSLPTRLSWVGGSYMMVPLPAAFVNVSYATSLSYLRPFRAYQLVVIATSLQGLRPAKGMGASHSLDYRVAADEAANVNARRATTICAPLRCWRPAAPPEACPLPKAVH